MLFWNQNGIHRDTKKRKLANTVLVPKRHKKVQKIKKILFFSETIHSKLSKDVPNVFKTILEQILCFDEVWSHMAKSAILAIFGEK